MTETTEQLENTIITGQIKMICEKISILFFY